MAKMCKPNQVLEKKEGVEEDKKEKEEDEEEEEESAPGSTLFIKNLNFCTTEEKLQEVGQVNHFITLNKDNHRAICKYCCFFLYYRNYPNVAKSRLAQSPRKKIKQVLNIQTIKYIK